MKKIYIAFSLFLLVFAIGFAMNPVEASANSYHYNTSHYPVYGYSGGHYDYGNPYCYDGCMGYVDHNYYSADNYPPYLLPTTGPVYYDYSTDSGNCNYPSCSTCGYSSCNNSYNNYGNSYGYSNNYNGYNSNDYSYSNNYNGYNSNDYQDYSYGNSYSYGYSNNGGYYGYGY